ncbi:hypothetical protein C8F04DRAFT_1182296 [Mycena alexandri]|uniref:Uncharacterized protein n=1 Tax=Mycena alexandri TaxID=1745969 RepID=A0AAD6SWK5_9AGAR|nr:hypothetical protein C8F04DRAFT_1182296 [Mycena alexandri]
MFEPRGIDSKLQHSATRARVMSTSEADPSLSDASTQFAQWSLEGGTSLYTNNYEARFALNMTPLLDSHLTLSYGRGDHGIVSPTEIEAFLNRPRMTSQYLDSSYTFHTGADNLLAPSDALNYASAPSPAGSGTSSGSLSRYETFECHPCLEYELPSSKDIHRPETGRGKPLSSMYSGATDLGHNNASSYTAAAALYPTPEWTVPQPAAHWGTAPSCLPYISQNRRGGVPQISPYPQYDAVQRFPTVEELRHWPQVKVVYAQEKRKRIKPAINACVGKEFVFTR